MSSAPVTPDTNKDKDKIWRVLLEWICRKEKEWILDLPIFLV